MSEQVDLIRTIVQHVLAEQAKFQPPEPELHLVSLNNNNYKEWCKKMRFALMFYKMWLNPELSKEELDEEQKLVNERAFLFIVCHLDEQNSKLINDRNKFCFLTTWKDIQQFYKPRSPLMVLTDIICCLNDIEYKSGQSIVAHLLKLEEQFSRFQEIGEVISEELLVAMTLASVRKSQDFAHIFHSILWKDEESLTLSKVRSILISSHLSQN